MGRRTNLNSRIPSREAADTREIFQLSDFENVSLPTITLEERLYTLKDAISAGLTQYQLIFPQNATISITADNRLKALLVSQIAVDAFFETTANAGNLTLNFDNLAVIYIGSPTNSFLFDIAFLAPVPALALGGFSTIESDGGIFRGFESLGTITNPQIVSFQNCFFEGYVNGLIFDEPTDIGIFNSEFITTGTGSGSSISVRGDVSVFTLNNVAFTLGASQSVVRIDPGIPDNARINITNAVVKGASGASLFDIEGDDGTFTAVADNSSSGLSITDVISGAVVNGDNAARFQAAVSSMFVGQLVTLSGFTGGNSVYNGTHRVTFFSVILSEFECLNVVFVAGQPGTLDIDAVTVTSSTHGLMTGNTVTINTSGSSDYDGGAFIFNETANTFDISRTFTQTRTGSWSTRGLDHTDARVLATNNQGFISSKNIACSFLNDSTASTTVATQNLYQNLNFDFMGGINQSSIAERFKLINTTTGATVFTGNEPFEGFLSFYLSAVATGSGSIFKFKFVLQVGGSGSFVDFPDVIEAKAEIKSTLSNSSVILPVILNKGDVYKLQVNNVDGTENIIVSDISIYSQD